MCSSGSAGRGRSTAGLGEVNPGVREHEAGHEDAELEPPPPPDQEHHRDQEQGQDHLQRAEIRHDPRDLDDRVVLEVDRRGPRSPCRRASAPGCPPARSRTRRRRSRPTLAIASVVVSSMPEAAGRDPAPEEPQLRRDRPADRPQHAPPERAKHRGERAQQRPLSLALEPRAELPALLLVPQPPVRVHDADDRCRRRSRTRGSRGPRSPRPSRTTARRSTRAGRTWPTTARSR